MAQWLPAPSARVEASLRAHCLRPTLSSQHSAVGLDTGVVLARSVQATRPFLSHGALATSSAVRSGRSSGASPSSARLLTSSKHGFRRSCGFRASPLRVSR